ncbi:MAG: anti-sigma factor [Exilibacterium sp.]
MYRWKDGDKPLEEVQVDAFEFVAGTLRGPERAEFEQQYKNRDDVQKAVQFWEQQLFGLQKTQQTLEPKPETWNNITRAISQPAEKTPSATDNKQRWNPMLWLPWGLTAALFLFVIFGKDTVNTLPVEQNPADYVAVLTNHEGGVQLTALTTNSSKKMWLKWETVDIADGRDMQLWAISRSDGQTRSIAVLNNTESSHLTLSEANWRLVKDAHELILTEEESGGSPLDEPSDAILAKGICVRFASSAQQMESTSGSTI